MLESMVPHPLDRLHAGVEKTDSGAVTKVSHLMREVGVNAIAMWGTTMWPR